MGGWWPIQNVILYSLLANVYLYIARHNLYFILSHSIKYHEPLCFHNSCWLQANTRLFLILSTNEFLVCFFFRFSMVVVVGVAANDVHESWISTESLAGLWHYAWRWWIHAIRRLQKNIVFVIALCIFSILIEIYCTHTHKSTYKMSRS